MTTTERVRERLQEVVDPCSVATGSNLNVVEMGLIRSVSVDGDSVAVEMRLTTPACHMVGYFQEEVTEQVVDLPGVESVRLETDNGLEWSEEMLTDEARQRRRAVIEEHRARYEEETADGDLPEPTTPD